MKHFISAAAVTAMVALSGQTQAAPITGKGDPTDHAALAVGTILDFESTAQDSYNSLTIGDVTFSSGNNINFGIDDTWAGRYNTRGQQYLVNSLTGPQFLRFDFADTVNAFAFLFGAIDSNWILTAYDSASRVLDSISMGSNGSSNDGDYLGIEHAGISYATLRVNGRNDNVFIDNFTYASSAVSNVPAPAAAGLLGLGLIGMAGLRRRKKHA